MQGSSSRRRFLKDAAVTGVAAGILPAVLHASQTTEEIYPAKEKDLVFLFQGDSITDGNRGRNADPNHIMGHGYAFAIAARVGADFPANGFTFYNRGISGNRIPDLQKRWEQDAIALKPDILSLLVGINDVNALIDKKPDANSLEEFENGYRTLLQQCKTANPPVLFVLGIPFATDEGRTKGNFPAWQNETLKRAAIVRKLAAEFDAVVVDYAAMFEKAFKKAPPAYWIWDGIHPTVPGHELMAREWIKQVAKRLAFLKVYKY
ncbi:MAG: SGNH/GDSL hydrolase family protein [Chitinophagaceae bacterium]